MTEHRCRYAGEHHPRLLPGRHLEDCTSETCSGCQPCDRAHCRICSSTHAAGVCAECLAETRETLREIGRLCDSLPEEVKHRGIDGEAMTLLGPVADVEARQHVEAAYLSGRLPEGWIDAAHGKGCPLLANEPCIGCAGGERHPLTVLGTWEMIWRAELEHDSEDVVTVPGAVEYLDRQLTYMAGYPHAPFEDFARDLRRCRTHLESVLHDGDQVEEGRPCPHCGRALVRTYGQRVADDRWQCPRQGCSTSYTVGQYRGWVEEDARQNADRLSAADMALRFTDPDQGVELKASTVRVWGAKGQVRKRGKDQATGMTLYDVADVAERLDRRAESA